MKILVLGGTGAMGTPLVDNLVKVNHSVWVTSRKNRVSTEVNLHYILGNAKDDTFLQEVLSQGEYDAVVDFMHYRPADFEARIKLLLESTSHYFFLSSSRVYAPSEEPITEKSQRLLDVVTDSNYLATDEYALSKARCEDMLFKSGLENWTIIRPYITYNDERLQLSVFEKEGWLFRALEGHSIVFSKDLAEKVTTLTHGNDVARVIQLLIEKKIGFGEALHIVGHDSMTWGEVLQLYKGVIKKEAGKEVNIVMLDSSKKLSKVIGNTYKWKYDRLSNRVFDSSRVDELCGYEFEYTEMAQGLKDALKSFLNKKQDEKPTNMFLEAYLDRCSKEHRRYFGSMRSAVQYCLYRYTPLMDYRIFKRSTTWW